MERTIKAQDLKSTIANVTLIDVRRKSDIDADTSKLPGATWHDPEQIETLHHVEQVLRAHTLYRKDHDYVVKEGEDCVAAATVLAERLAVMPTKAMVSTRHLLREASTRTLNQQLDAERDVQSAMGHTHDYIEGVMAFKEKRPAKFRGA